MRKIRELLSKPVVNLALGILLGFCVGLFMFGWWLTPVTWTDASAKELRADMRVDYLKMAIESYGRNPNDAVALQRWSELKEKGPEALQSLQLDPTVNRSDLEVFGRVVTGGASLPVASNPQAGQTQQPAQGAQQGGTPTPLISNPAGLAETPAAAQETPGVGLNLILLLVIFGGLTLAIGAILVFLLFIRPRLSSGNNAQPAAKAAAPIEDEGEMAYASGDQGEPIAQFMTTYTLGDDLYDDSFSIDSPNGEFLGECGVGVSDTIGVGDPKKVSAFEVWLFDKNDIQTVTKVLMSEHGFNDPEISQKLAAKGEPILVAPGKHIVLETATLQMEARIVDTSYGQGALPPSSFFDRMTLELAVWPKHAG